MKPMVNEIKQQNEISLQVLYKYKSSDYLVQLNIICLEFVSLKVQCIQLKYMYEIFKDLREREREIPFAPSHHFKPCINLMQKNCEHQSYIWSNIINAGMIELSGNN